MSHIEDTLPPHTVESTLTGLGLGPTASAHPPRVLILCGSIRSGSYSRLLAAEAARVLTAFGADVRLFDPTGLPAFDRVSREHDKVQELRRLSHWSEAQVWISPEQHGAMSSIMKGQLDWIPLSDGAIRPTQGRTLTVMQVEGGSQSFNTVNQLRILGRWMRMLTIPNQSSVARVWQEFDAEGRMKPSSYRDRVVDVLEELFHFTILVRDHTAFLTTRHSEQQRG